MSVRWGAEGRATQAWGRLLKSALEPFLKRLFICRSGRRRHNRGMSLAPLCLSLALRRAVVALSVLLLGGTAAVQASDHDERDHERARQAMTTGQVLPLRTVLERLEREHPGQVLEVELERDGGRWTYEVKLLARDGQLVKILLDARTAAVLGSRSRPGRDRTR